MALKVVSQNVQRRRLAARSLDVPEAGSHLLEDFFRPLEALGSAPALMARWLKRAGVGPNARVLDLGCGKGAAGIEIARVTGGFVTGVDAFEPFVLHARGMASVKGVGARCDFRVGLAERFRSRPFDAVVFLNVFPFERAIPVARRLTVPGGLYLIDDAVAIRASAFPTSRDVVEAIEAGGDRVVRSKVWTKAHVQKRELANYELLRRNAKSLVKERPRDRDLVAEFLKRMRAGIADLSADIRPACWLVRRGRR